VSKRYCPASRGSVSDRAPAVWGEGRFRLAGEGPKSLTRRGSQS